MGGTKEVDKPYELAIKFAKFYGGKICVAPYVPVYDLKDFAVWYTPGVAEVCRAIQKDPEKVWYYTNRWNFIAVITNGTRVLGLGDIGPEASIPVMEGKALLFKYLGGVDAISLPINVKDPDVFIETVKRLEPAFGGINLEDIRSPDCFYILERLRKEMDIVVWHDDQQGTAGATLAGLINALKLTGRNLRDAKIAFIGCGAANIANARVIEVAGGNPKNWVFVDSKGILHRDRPDMEELKKKNPWKYEWAMRSNEEGRKGGIKEAMEGMDVVIAASRPGPGMIKKEWVASMEKDPIVFAEANPVPEIWPWEAKEAGARIVATGRSDFPNQVNNSLVFPSVFRGALEVRARTITDEMAAAAALELAKFAEEKGLREDYIIPTMLEWEVYPRVATATGLKAIEQGVARKVFSREELYSRCEEKIKEAREQIRVLMEAGVIRAPPEGKIYG
ncbi:MAG: malate dehydrogenase [Thermoproteota archaeon]|nr:MAG: malate dehydrogenase [Candidatus Korarchaeota archaeon]